MIKKGRNAAWFLAALMATGSGVQARPFEEIAEARAEQVRHMQGSGEEAGIGVYGLTMQSLVAAGYVEPNGDWKDPHKASWTGQDGVSTYDDFLESAAAQDNAYGFYLNGTFEHLTLQKPEISVDLDGRKMGAQDVLKTAPYARPHEMVDWVISGDPDTLNGAAIRSGFQDGRDLIRAVVLAVRIGASEESTPGF